MKFYYKPKESIVQNLKNKVTGKITRFLVCVFDNNGELETNDPKVIQILQKHVDCTWNGEETKETDIMSEDELRKLAKEKGIKSWHNKKIDKIKKELEEIKC